MINITTNVTSSKEDVMKSIERYLSEVELTVASRDFSRPWGGFFVIDETQAERFIKLYFPHLKVSDLTISGKLSPKILVVNIEEDMFGKISFHTSQLLL